MANYNDIRAILQTAVGGTLSSSELDTLASAIVASAGGDTDASTASVANVKAKRDLAAVLGRVSEMRKLDVELAEKQYEQQKLTIAQIVASGQALDGELVTALQKAEVHYLKLKAAQDQAGKSGAVLSQIIDDTASTLLNLGKTGVTSLGVFIDIKDALGELTGAADEYKTNAQEATAAAEKENQAAKERVKRLEEEAQKTGDAIGKQAELAEAKAEAAEAAEKLKEAQAKLGEETKKSGKAAGYAKAAFAKFAQGDMAKGFVQQFDPLNVLFSRIQQTFEQARNIQNESLDLFRETGLVVGDATKGYDRFRETLTATALDSATLSVESNELTNAVVSLQAAFTRFDPKGQEGLIKTFAVLEQAGISTQQSAETFAFFRQALGKTDKDAEQLTLNMMSLANELKRPPSEIAQAFQQGSKSLAAYGRDFVKVQEKMIRVASRLGVEVDGLIGAFDAMDTIEGAAETAGKINQILGVGIGKGLNQIALANADLPDKIKMVRNAIIDSGQKDLILNNRKMLKALSEAIPGTDPAMVLKLLQEDADFNKEIAKNTAQGNKEDIEARIVANQTADQRTKLATEKQTFGQQENASGLMDTIAEYSGGITAALSGVAAVAQVAMGMAAFKKGGGGGPAALIAAATGGEDDDGGGGGGGAMGGLMGDCVRICNDSMADMGRTFHPGGRTAADAVDDAAQAAQESAQDIVETTSEGFSGMRGGLNAMAGRATGGFLSQDAGAAFTGKGVGGIMGALGATTAVLGTAALAFKVGTSLFDAVGDQQSGAQTAKLYSGGGYFGGVGATAVEAGKSKFKRDSIAQYGDWKAKSIEEQFNYCRANNMQAPPYQGGPSCGVVNAKKFGSKTQKNDFTVSDFKKGVNANMSDEIIGVKEGGLIAKKLDRLISLMAQSSGKEIVLKLDRKEIARSVISTVNNDFYNVGV